MPLFQVEIDAVSWEFPLQNHLGQVDWDGTELEKGVPADGLPAPLRGGGGGRPPVLFLAVAVFDFLAGVGGSEESVAGAFRFPELEAFCAVCAMLVRFGCSDR
jgi:hypothetical protein